jgi:N-acetyl-gamma-glutamyl-phosphate reductase
VSIRVVIVGAAGYAGAELASLLLRHSQARIVGIFGSARRDEHAPTLSEVFGRFRGLLDLPIRAASVSEIKACEPDAVFLATPHLASIELATGLLEGSASRRCVVFDLSAAFRLKDARAYPSRYGFEHPRPDLLAKAVYGLPELWRDAVRHADLVAVPGCYPTSAILPLAPLVRAGAVAKRPDGRCVRPIIDSTSGVSGAGRTPELRSMFCEVHQKPYAVLSHRHQPEIDAYVGVETLFTPHLGPYERGILSTIHVELERGWNEMRVRDVLAEAYAGEMFVRLCRADVWPSVGDVRGTNYCDIAIAVDEPWSHLLMVSAIDNLVKGAAGQAVQCMNVRFGFSEATGLKF